MRQPIQKYRIILLMRAIYKESVFSLSAAYTTKFAGQFAKPFSNRYKQQ
jgi:hypothetical protein